MSHDAFDERRKALEEQFFAKNNEALVQKMRDAAQRTASKAELQQLTGIANEQVLDAMAALKIGGAATLVMSLYPMLAVAWADGKIDEKERTVILGIAETVGLKSDGAGYSYLQRWLAEKPEISWQHLWADYVQALVAQMKSNEKELLKQTVLGRARVVAEISGGIMGVVWNVSKAEQSVLAKLETAFD
jgi:tellurite resistance protein